MDKTWLETCVITYFILLEMKKDNSITHDAHSRMRKYAALRLRLARWGCREINVFSQYTM